MEVRKVVVPAGGGCELEDAADSPGAHEGARGHFTDCAATTPGHNTSGGTGANTVGAGRWVGS